MKMTYKSDLFGDELLSAVFANFSKEKQGFRTTESELMDIFYGLLNKSAYKVLARQYPFDSDGPEPKSKALSDAFASLQQSRLIGRLNPDLVVYKISPALAVRYARFIEPKLNRNKNLIRKFAKEVEQKLAGVQ
ncbi:MAG: hypothetical protein ACYCUV_09315 [Phycisphaerae bacterium]